MRRGVDGCWPSMAGRQSSAVAVGRWWSVGLAAWWRTFRCLVSDCPSDATARRREDPLGARRHRSSSTDRVRPRGAVQSALVFHERTFPDCGATKRSATRLLAGADRRLVRVRPGALSQLSAGARPRRVPRIPRLPRPPRDRDALHPARHRGQFGAGRALQPPPRTADVLVGARAGSRGGIRRVGPWLLPGVSRTPAWVQPPGAGRTVPALACRSAIIARVHHRAPGLDRCVVRGGLLAGVTSVAAPGPGGEAPDAGVPDESALPLQCPELTSGDDWRRPGPGPPHGDGAGGVPPLHPGPSPARAHDPGRGAPGDRELSGD